MTIQEAIEKVRAAVTWMPTDQYERWNINEALQVVEQAARSVPASPSLPSLALREARLRDAARELIRVWGGTGFGRWLNTLRAIDALRAALEAEDEDV